MEKNQRGGAGPECMIMVSNVVAEMGEGELLWTMNSENDTDRVIASTMMVKRMLLQQRSRIATQSVRCTIRIRIS